MVGRSYSESEKLGKGKSGGAEKGESDVRKMYFGGAHGGHAEQGVVCQIPVQVVPLSPEVRSGR